MRHVVGQVPCVEPRRSSQVGQLRRRVFQPFPGGRQGIGTLLYQSPSSHTHISTCLVQRRAGRLPLAVQWPGGMSPVRGNLVAEEETWEGRLLGTARSDCIQLGVSGDPR